MATKHGLGRGLGALIEAAPGSGAPPSDGTPPAKVSIAKVETNPHQPRRIFSPEALQDLVSSIREKGVLQPLLVRRKGAGYELIAGERRLRAAREAGLSEVPVIVKDVADRESLELALVENLQREDLNVMEEAEGFRDLADRFGMTQEQIAVRVGKARASVTNTMRLLTLPAEVKSWISEGKLSAGHAKILLGTDIEDEQRLLAQRCITEGLSVRQLERIVSRTRRMVRKPFRRGEDDIPASHVSHLSDTLHRHFGTSVRIIPCRTMSNGKKARGTLEIDFYSGDDLSRILHLLGLEDRP